MAIDPGDVVKINALVEEPNLDFVQEIVVDNGSGAIPKKMTMATLKRTKVDNIQDESGNATATADYTDYNAIEITIDRDCTITVSNIEDKEVVWLKIIKGTSDQVTLSTAPTGSNYITSVSQYGTTNLLYKITQYKTATSEVRYFEPIIVQNIDTSITLTPTVGTITLKDYFESTVNNDVCHFEGSFTYNHTSYSALSITITNWLIDKKNTGQIAASSWARNSGNVILSACRLDAGILNITFDNTLTGDTEILVSGHFKVN